MIHAATVRSPLPCGTLRKVEFPPLPTGYRGILPSDIPGRNSLRVFGAEMPIFADERLSYAGEPVALVAGPDPALADELAAATLVVMDEGEPRLGWESFASDQVLSKKVAVLGDPEMAFTIAATTIEDSYRTGAIEHCYSEAQGAAAAYDYDKMALWCATQWPYHVRDSVAAAIACDPAEVSVRPTRLGVHLDGKLWYPSLLACQAAVAAIVCGRPVKILLTREEDFRFSTKRARSSVGLRAAMDESGRLIGLDARIAVNVGAFGPLAEEILSQAVLAATGVYDCANVRVEGYAVSTNTPPFGAFGGLGASHSFYAMEGHANRISSSSGENPVDWRSRNVLRKGSPIVTGETLAEDAPFGDIAERLCAVSDFRRKYACYELIRKRRSSRPDGPLRGIGFSFAYQGSGPFLSGETSNSYSVEASLDKNLRATIRTSAAVASEGVTGIWRRTAAEVLGLGMESVSIAKPSTDQVPNSGPSTLSRNIAIVNHLVSRACEGIQKRRFRDPLPIQARSVYRVPKPVRWKNGVVQGTVFAHVAWGGACVELELDPMTREPRLVGSWLCVDGGEIVSRERAAAALRAGVIDALGACLRETIDPSDGCIGPEEYFRYSLLPLGETPPIVVDFLSPVKRAQAKGIGELPFDLIPAAFLSALSQAAGSPFSSLPVDLGDIIRAVETA